MTFEKVELQPVYGASHSSPLPMRLERSVTRHGYTSHPVRFAWVDIQFWGLRGKSLDQKEQDSLELDDPSLPRSDECRPKSANPATPEASRELKLTDNLDFIGSGQGSGNLSS